jgi:hypothetical protein
LFLAVEEYVYQPEKIPMEVTTIQGIGKDNKPNYAWLKDFNII